MSSGRPPVQLNQNALKLLSSERIAPETAGGVISAAANKLFGPHSYSRAPSAEIQQALFDLFDKVKDFVYKKINDYTETKEDAENNRAKIISLFSEYYASGCSLCLMSDNIKPERGKLYLREKNGYIEYTVITPNNVIVRDIKLATPLAPNPFTLDNLNRFKEQILKATSEAGHTLLSQDLWSVLKSKAQEFETKFQKSSRENSPRSKDSKDLDERQQTINSIQHDILQAQYESSLVWLILVGRLAVDRYIKEEKNNKNNKRKIADFFNDIYTKILTDKEKFLKENPIAKLENDLTEKIKQVTEEKKQDAVLELDLLNARHQLCLKWVIQIMHYSANQCYCSGKFTKKANDSELGKDFVQHFNEMCHNENYMLVLLKEYSAYIYKQKEKLKSNNITEEKKKALEEDCLQAEKAVGMLSNFFNIMLRKKYGEFEKCKEVWDELKVGLKAIKEKDFSSIKKINECLLGKLESLKLTEKRTVSFLVSLFSSSIKDQLLHNSLCKKLVDELIGFLSSMDNKMRDGRGFAHRRTASGIPEQPPTKEVQKPEEKTYQSRKERSTTTTLAVPPSSLSLVGHPNRKSHGLRITTSGTLNLSASQLAALRHETQSPLPLIITPPSPSKK